ncbi:hypothetical protein HMPREF9103_00601 [Lentilactobacillus parafarraginis F0439]|uniref:Uncharacterized protein n=1 Tax=Lentilactobacillus parafarraginis F0439 TaxID=797515 RepID=G9ZLJ5_9LACO|nr:hypothetical protein HMPREF9103_00601 [Lentilactobacillus parafarraginis F0439]
MGIILISFFMFHLKKICLIFIKRSNSASFSLPYFLESAEFFH